MQLRYKISYSTMREKKRLAPGVGLNLKDKKKNNNKTKQQQQQQQKQVLHWVGL